MHPYTSIRWKQRFEHFEKAYNQLVKGKVRYMQDPQDEIIRAGMIQIFEMTFELAWKTAKDYLSEMGQDVKYPADVIRQAFQSSLITDGEVWLEALHDRNSTSHLYDESAAIHVVDKIQKTYIEHFEQLIRFFREKL